MDTHARITSALLPATPAAPALLLPGARLAAGGAPASLCIVTAPAGVAYLRRGSWAAFLHTGERVGQFPSAGEATAALGGAA